MSQITYITHIRNTRTHAHAHAHAHTHTHKHTYAHTHTHIRTHTHTHTASKGVHVTKVLHSSPAALSGCIAVGDILTSVDGNAGKRLCV